MTQAARGDELSRRLTVGTISVVAWSGVAGLFLLQRLSGAAIQGVEARHVALDLTVNWGTWAALTPLIFTIVRRLPLPSEHPARMLMHLPLGVGVGTLHSLLVAVITPLYLWRPSLLPIRDMFAGRLASAIASETLVYFLVVAVLYAVAYASQSGQRQLARSVAEAELARAQRDVESLEQERQQLTAQLSAIPDRGEKPESFAVPARDGVVKVPIGTIDWLQAEDNYVRLHAAGRSHLLRTTLSSLEKRLASRDFVRIHRSALVSVSRIAGLKRLSSERYAVVLTTGAQLRVSRAHRQRVIDAVGSPLTPE